MKVLLLSGLSALVLAGCDNFQHLKDVSRNQVPQFKVDHTEVTPGSAATNPSAQGTQPTAPQAGDKALPGAPSIEAKPALPDGSKPAEAKPSENSAVPELKVERDTTPLPKPGTGPAVIIPVSVVPAQGAKTPNAETVTTPAPVQSPVATQTPAPTKPEAEKKTGGEVEQKTAAKVEQKAAEAKTDESKPLKESTLDITEFENLKGVLHKFFVETSGPESVRPLLPANMDHTDVKPEAKGNIDGFALRVLNKDKSIAEVKDLKISLKTVTTKTVKDYQISAVCAGGKCEILIIIFSKYDDKKKLVENYPSFLKLVNGQYVHVTYKKSDEYAADRNAIKSPNKIKLVPQLAVSDMLVTFLNSAGAKLIETIKKRLEANPTLVYSDKLIGHSTMKTKNFIPQFAREDGKLMISAKLEFTTPKSPIEFKGEVKAEGPSDTIQTKAGLLMTVVPLVKDQFYLVLLDQQKYSSKIVNVNSAFQALVCSVVEVEKTIFSECTPLVASIIFSEAGVVEASFKEKLKEGK